MIINIKEKEANACHVAQIFHWNDVLNMNEKNELDDNKQLEDSD